MKGISYRLEADATVVSNTFIDKYMTSASGEYVKVYLYLLRHGAEAVEVAQIAEALNHTEADVKRALVYWHRAGVIVLSQDDAKKEETQAQQTVFSEPAPAVPVPKAFAPRQEAAALQPEKRSLPADRKPCTAAQMNRLQTDEDFTQLLYIAQKYMNKIFRQQECEVFAYLYDTLKMPAELLEYLVEYCAQNGHTAIRYIETVALNWHERGLHTAEQAQAYTAGFSRNSFAVMKAFGLSGRKPGDTEQKMIETWFGQYGFAKDIVLEACNRTLEATHTPSFRYADKILSNWKECGVKSLQDIESLDGRHEAERSRVTEKRAAGKAGSGDKNSKNQFHNFRQRDTDYNTMVLERLKEQFQEQ